MSHPQPVENANAGDLQTGPVDRGGGDALATRVNRVHLRQRLGIETEREARVFGQGRTWFHIENWVSVHGAIRFALRLAGLHGRGRRNARAVALRENRVPIAQLPGALDGFTVLHLSDLHLDMAPDFPGVIMERVADLDYDVAVMTGDFRAATRGPWEAAVDALRRLRPGLREPLFAVLGNHDSIRMVPAMEALGVRVLLNESVAIERGGARLWLAGVDDPHYFRADNIEKACDPIPDDEVSVLLAHTPEIYRHAAHAGFDLMLCGHTHGGQICLPGGMPLMTNAKCPRRYCAGAWRHDRLQGYTSRGTGVSVVDVRLNCPGEVTLHRLVRG